MSVTRPISVTKDEGYRTRRDPPLSEELTHSDNGQKAKPSEILGIPERIDAKTFRWGTMRHNDCTMTNAEFSVFADGRAVFFANVTTSDADDVWLVRGLAFIDRNGVEMWRMPQFNGPNMVIDNFNYIFHNPNLAFPVYIFPHIDRMTMYHHC